MFLPQDLAHLLRVIRRSPGFFATTILTLALGIGAALALFTLVRGLILKPLPYPHADRLAQITSRYQGDDINVIGVLDAADIQAGSNTLQDLALYGTSPRSMDLGGLERPEVVRAWTVSWNLLPMLGASPLHGRSFASEDGGEPVVLLNHAFWQRRFGGDPKVVGKSLLLGGKARTILGVMRPGLAFPGARNTDCFLPLQTQNARRGHRSLSAIALLKPGASLIQFQSDLDRIGVGLAEKYTRENQGWKFIATDLQKSFLGDRRSALLLLMGASALLFLIACANAANLFLARALQRRSENALRAALGANSSQRFRHHLADGLVVGLSAGLLGSALALGAIRMLPWILPELREMITITRLDLDPTVWGVTLLLSLATSVGFALIPLLHIRESRLLEALHASGRGSSRPGRRTRAMLLMTQSALAVLVLSLGGLFLHSFQKVLDIDPGFNHRGLLSFRLELPGNRYTNLDAIRRFQSELLRQMKDLPGKPSVAMTDSVPFGGDTMSTDCHEVPTLRDPSAWPSTFVQGVSEGYFDTLKLPIQKGRPILDTDVAKGPKVAVISEYCARLVFPGQNPLGRRIFLGLGTDESPEGTEMEVVGVCGNARHVALSLEPKPRIFFPNQQIPMSNLKVILRSDAKPEAMRGALEDRVRTLDPDLPLRDLERVEDLGRKQIAELEQTLRLLGIFAALGLAIASFGIYSVVSYNLAQRTREIGIRMALGAGLGRLLWMILGQGLVQMGLGAFLGSLAALAIGRLIQAQLLEVGYSDPIAMALAWSALGLTGTLAMLIPALRAASVQPAVALRSE